MPRAQSTVDQGRTTRKAVLDAAVELFGTYGYRDCSLAEVAARAGIGRSGLLHHFGSKEQLLLETLAEFYPALRNNPDALAVERGAISFPDLLVRTAVRNKQNPTLVRFFSVVTGECLTLNHPAREFVIERYDVMRAEYAAALGGTCPDPRVITLVATAFGAMDGLQTQWLRNPESVDLVAGVELIADFVRIELRALGIGAPATPSLE